MKKIRTSIDIEPAQKRALQLISAEKGIPMGKQVQFALDLYLLEHKDFLKKTGFKFNSTDKIS